MNMRILEKIKDINKLESFIAYVYYLSYIPIFIWITGYVLKTYICIFRDTLLIEIPHILGFWIFLYIKQNYIKMIDITFKSSIIACVMLAGFFTSVIEINNTIIFTVIQFIMSIPCMWWLVSYNNNQNKYQVFTVSKIFQLLFMLSIICKILFPVFLVQYMNSYIFNILFSIVSIFTYVLPYYFRISARKIRQIIISLFLLTVFVLLTYTVALYILISAESLLHIASNALLISLSYACYVYMILVFRELYENAKNNKEKHRIAMLAAVGLILVQISPMICSIWIIGSKRKLLK